MNRDKTQQQDFFGISLVFQKKTTSKEQDVDVVAKVFQSLSMHKEDCNLIADKRRIMLTIPPYGTL